jgi:hypothetical protein
LKKPQKDSTELFGLNALSPLDWAHE